MLHRVIGFISVIVFVAFAALALPSASQAGTVGAPALAISPYELIDAVNALRASNGLPRYSVNSILMYTAQAQADFMAANGIVTHSGPGGIGLTDRLLAAGYPLAGDLSAGGFRAENVSSGTESTSAQIVVNGWMGDAPHMNTMLSSNLTEMGAGVAVSGGRVYFVIDCARPTTDGVPQASTAVVGDGTAVPAREAPISVVVLSTPNSSGNIIHEVLFGQSLWQIAIAYDVKIDDIKRLNNLTGNDIYPGEKLLIRQGVILPTAPATNSPMLEAVASSTPVVASMAAKIQPVFMSTPTVVSSGVSGNNASIIGAVIGILALALLGGGVFMWLGGSKRV
jgi:uncharacterized protein YkwD